MIGQLLMSLLQVNATTGVSANLLDSQDEGVRVHHNRTPQGTNIAGVVYHIIVETPAYQKGGVATHDEAQVQFDVYHPSDFEAATIAANLRTILEGWTGTHDGDRYNYTTLDAIRDGYSDELDTPKRQLDFTFRKTI